MLRHSLLWLSEQQGIFNFIRRNGLARQFASRFVAGESVEEAVSGAKELQRHDMSATLDLLGESVSQEDEAAAAPDQYFEMLQAYEELLAEDNGYQMIFRMYPGKNFMASPYAKPIIHYAKSLPSVYVSIGDPDYRVGSKDKAVMQIEQFELWHAFQYSDVVINYFSTVALESCVFDRPVISML